MDKLLAVHPGTVLAADFLDPLHLDVEKLAEALSVRPQLLRSLVSQKAPVTAELALRLARYFGTSGEFWLNLQQAHDLSVAADELGDRLRREVTPRGSHH